MTRPPVSEVSEVSEVSGVGGVRTDARWAGLAVLTVLVGLGLLLVGDHHYYWYGDTPAAYYGWWYHLGDLVRHGHWATLDPHAWRSGNIAAEGQWGLWSPLTIGIGLLATVVPDMLVLTVAVKLALVAAAVVGIYLLVRSYDAPPAAAYVAAVLAPMGGMTQYLDLPSWAAGEMIWALFPWAWWGLRRTMLRGANPLPALAAGYLLVSVGYVFGTIMLVVAIAACLVDCYLTRDRAAALRVLGAGILLGLVALTVYLPGVLTSSVSDRSSAFTPFGGKFSTDPLALIAGVLPTSSVPNVSSHLLPYAYLAWLLPTALWIDWGRARRAWRPLGGLIVVTVVTLAIVDGPSQLGPLRWPLRLAPFLVTGLVVLVAVAGSRFGLARPSPRRLALSMGWVVLAALLAVVRASSEWRAHLCATALVAGAIVLLWWLLRTGRRSWLAPVAGVVTLAAFGVQHAFFPTPPSPQRNAPTELSTYQALYPDAVGDLLQVGATDVLDRTDPGAARQLPIGSGWYLTGLPAQNTYTAVSQRVYKYRYCVYYQGDTCPQLLDTLFTTEPTTGTKRVDLLGVSSLLLIRQDFPARRLRHPPAGWQVAEHTPYAVLWTRRTPVPRAGHVAWTSPGTMVSSVQADATSTTFRVDRVPAGGGMVVLSLLDWPGYSTSAGSLGDPVDGYLVTVHLPASAQGESVEVAFDPPGWTAEVAAWVLALLGGALWSLAAALSPTGRAGWRRWRRPGRRTSAG
ncbi:MAG TPA: hypothetical protein VGK78_05405 [Nocardioides sp.]|uniref:hypothetical protein n=1 Tax=Nocardioides sp. TaxID=35761 RepID=UPI002F41F547